MKTPIRQLVLVALFAAMTAVGAMVAIPAGPVPITLQTLFVLLSGILLGPKWGAVSQLVYLLLGLLGLPIFAGFSGGFAQIFKPSFGFLLSFAPSAALAGALTVRRRMTPGRTLFVCLCATALQYALGTPYMILVLKHVAGADSHALMSAVFGLMSFLPGDGLKTLLAVLIAPRLLPVITAIFPPSRAV